MFWKGQKIIFSSSVTEGFRKTATLYKQLKQDLELDCGAVFHEWRPDIDGTNSDLTSVLVAH